MNRKALLEKIRQLGHAPVNCKYQPQIKRNKVLKKLLRTGEIELIRPGGTARKRGSKRQSYVRIAEKRA